MTAGRKINTLSHHWCTPSKYVKAIKAVLGTIELDPCSNEHSIVEAEVVYLLPEKDGLKESWEFNKIFVNPPYGSDHIRKTTIKNWLEKCAKTHEKYGSEVLALVPVATNTRHWKEHIWPTATGICFLGDTRLRFLDGSGQEGKGAPMACAMIYWGSKPEAFNAVFSEYGQVTLALRNTSVLSEPLYLYRRFTGTNNESK